MGINRFDALDGATTFQKRTHRIIQLLMRAGSSTFDFESNEGVLVKVGHGVNSGYNSYAGPKPRAEERGMGWQFHPSHLGKKSLSYHLSCPVHTQFRSSLALRFNRESVTKPLFTTDQVFSAHCRAILHPRLYAVLYEA